MLGKLKRVLGIEGIKLALTIKIPINKKDKIISGNMKFTTKTEGTIKSITIKLVEKYSRGRGKSKLVDEYVIAELFMDEGFSITPEEIVEVPFSMGYEKPLSEMDKMQRDNIFSRPLIGLAKMFKKVKSTYTLVAEADVAGTTLNPFDQDVVEL